MVEGRVKVGGILTYPGLRLIAVVSSPDRPGVASTIFESLGARDLNVQFIVQGVDQYGDAHVQFCVSAGDLQDVLTTLRPKFASTLETRISEGPPAALISVYGPDFRERPGIAGRAFGALAKNGINILAISTSISTVSCVIADADLDDAVRALHEVFALP